MRKDNLLDKLWNQHVKYDVTVDGHTFEVDCVPSMAGQARHCIQVLLEQLLRVPASLRQSLTRVELTDKPNPDDAYWAKKYDIPDFQSQATAGGGKITFWSLTPQNAEENLEHGVSHEVGHLVGETARVSESNLFERLFGGQPEKYPEDWPAAMQADGNAVDTGLKVGPEGKNYSESSPGEDFAEAFKAYLDSRASGMMGTMGFAMRYPNRLKVLSRIWNQQGGGA